MSELLTGLQCVYNLSSREEGVARFLDFYLPAYEALGLLPHNEYDFVESLGWWEKEQIKFFQASGGFSEKVCSCRSFFDFVWLSVFAT